MANAQERYKTVSARSVLIIDAECAFRRRLEKFLEYDRIQAVGVSSLESALTFLGSGSAGPLDAVVVCVDQLAEWELELLRSQLAGVPLVLTGYPPVPALDLPVVVKPFPPERLVSRIRRVWAECGRRESAVLVPAG